MVDTHVDKITAVEFYNTAMNDSVLYHHLYYDWYNNYGRKKHNGTFDKEKAIDGLVINYIPKVVSMYKREFGGSAYNPRLNQTTKKYLATLFYNDLWNEMGLKNVRKDRPFIKRERK